MSKVFLGGTCNNSTWREQIIPRLEIDYFNPVVEDWTPECKGIEDHEKEIVCDIHLYVITKEIIGVYSIAEMIDSAYQDDKSTIIQVVPEGFDEKQLKSFKATLDLADSIGAYTIMSNDFDELVDVLNQIDENIWESAFE